MGREDQIGFKEIVLTKFKDTGVIWRTIDATALGALAGDAAIIVANDLTPSEDFRALKVETFAEVVSLTAGQGDSLLYGIANGELSAVEIAECLTIDGPDDRNDANGNEKAMRAVWLIGKLVKPAVSAVDGPIIGREGGPMMTWKKRWTFSNPEGMSWFIFNAGATLTTGASCRTQATVYGLWVT